MIIIFKYDIVKRKPKGYGKPELPFKIRYLYIKAFSSKLKSFTDAVLYCK